MSEFTLLTVFVPFRIDSADIDRLCDYEWEMDLQGNVFTPIQTDIGVVNCTLSRMTAIFYHTINDDECIRHKNGDKRDNRMENIEIVKRSSIYPPSTPVPDKENLLPKYIYKRNNKYYIYARIAGTTKYVDHADTLEEAIISRAKWAMIEAKKSNKSRRYVR